MIYFKATFQLKVYAPMHWIGEDGQITNRAADNPGEYKGFAEELPSEQSIHNMMAPKEIHSVVVVPITREEYES